MNSAAWTAGQVLPDQAFSKRGSFQNVGLSKLASAGRGTFPGLIEVAFLRQEDGGPGLEYLLLNEANDSPVLKLFLPRIKEHAMYRGTLPPSNGKHVTGEQ